MGNQDLKYQCEHLRLILGPVHKLYLKSCEGLKEPEACLNWYAEQAHW
jgi:hypothetical protein